MNRTMKMLSLITAMMSVMAHAQELYQPTRNISDQGISLKGWGNGLIAESTDRAVEGGNSIRISSRNFFQGGVINFEKPINVAEASSSKENLLHLNIGVPDSTTTRGPAGGGSSEAGGGIRGGVGLGGGGGIRGGAAAGGTTQENTLKTVRIVIATSDGKRSEGYLDLSTVPSNGEGWKSVGIPLQAISGFAASNKIISSISVSSDAIATFYVGSIKILNDRTPVFAEPNVREMNLAFGDEVTFTASGSAGSTPIRYSWDFDSRDGIQSDAEGPSIAHRFRKPGEFEVTLTATDIYGLKAPYSTKIKIVVNP